VAIKIDGSVADIVTLAVATICIFVRPVKRKWIGALPCFTLRDCIVDCLNGSTLVPFALLIASVMSSEILEEALKANKISMALAGIIGILFIIRELIA